MSKPKATYTLQGVLLKSTDADRQVITDVFSNIGVNFDLSMETSLSGDPTTVVLSPLSVLDFLFVRITDGPAVVTITPEGGSPVAIVVKDVLWLGGTRITGVTLAGPPGGNCRVLLYAGQS